MCLRRSLCFGLGLSALACTLVQTPSSHAESDPAHPEASGSASAQVGAAAPNGQVKPPDPGAVHVRDEPGPEREDGASEREAGWGRFSPAPLQAATETMSWLPANYEGPRASIELRNACALEFRYAFGPHSRPGELDKGRRVLDSYTIQDQVIPEGHWLHLWDGDRWLGTATTISAAGRMEIAATCDTLEVLFEIPGQGPTSLAIHWELDANHIPGDSGAGLDFEALAFDPGAAPERWGPDGSETVELNLLNLCRRPVDYVFVATPDAESETPSSLAGHSRRLLDVPPGWWLRYRVLEDGWRGGAATNSSGALMWIAADCVDFGIADGHHHAPRDETETEDGEAADEAAQ